MKKSRMIYIILPIILFILLAIFIIAGKMVGIEDWVYNASIKHMSPTLTSIIKFITHLGDPAIVIIICLVLLLIDSIKTKIGIPIGITVASASIFNIFLKNIFARERPNILRLVNEIDYSFPSGHAMINSALYIMLILLTFKYVKNKKIKIMITVISLLLIILIGFSRIYLGVHYISDIIGGYLLGCSIAVIVYSLNIIDNIKINKV